MTFHVGQKVVCISPKIGWKNPKCVEPDFGDIGTVCNVYMSASGELTLELTEFPSPAWIGYQPGWVAEDFRPVVDRKTDISFAHEILRTASQKERA